MRKWLSALAVVAAALAYPGAASAETPVEVYSDFAEDGALSCKHSRAALEGVLSDASLHQYGDPYTLLGLKLAVRKQLAGGCRRTTQATAAPATAGGGGFEESQQEPEQQAERAADQQSTPPPNREQGTSDGQSVDGSNPTAADELGAPNDPRDGRMLLVGVLLLLVTLASGGWAAKRAYTDRR